jgi:hypothetical protein
MSSAERLTDLVREGQCVGPRRRGKRDAAGGSLRNEDEAAEHVSAETHYELDAVFGSPLGERLHTRLLRREHDSFGLQLR